LPDVLATGLPAVSSAGLPAVSPVGLPDVLAAGLPTVTAPGLPEILAPGVPGFGRVDLPVPRPAELPDVRSGALGLDTLDLPGVGESLPSVPESWGEANLPLVGESLPTVRGARSIADVESPFGAFEPGAEGDPFAGSEADFGAPDGDDPFGAPASAGAEFAPMQGLDGTSAAPQRRDDVSGAGYGEVDIAGAEGDPASLETAEDMEFHAIPERSSAGPARAAASASVHAEAPDAEAAGSTLELGPERKAPKARARRLAMLAAVCLGVIGGGALALKPAIGPFGIHFVMDQIKRGERERALGKLVADAHEAQRRDTLGAVREVLRGLERARAEAPRFAPLSARSAFEHYAAVLRYGPLPDLEATAKVAIEQLDAEDDDLGARLARAAQAAATRAADAKTQLEALGADGDARAVLGELCLSQQDWAGATNVWAGLAKSDPQSARAAFALARIELGQRRYREATDAAQRVLALNPEHIGAPILLLEAQRALRASDPAAAEATPTEQLAAAVNQKLAAAAPAEAALAHCVLGELHASQGRTLPATQQFEAALVIDRTLPRALIGLGEVLHLAGRFSEALARFEAAAKAEPSSLAAQLGIAKSQIQLAHLNEAKTLLGRLPEADKARPETIFWTAKTEQALGNADAALSGYRAAIAAGKGRADSVDAYLALAKLQAELGQLAAAQDTLSEARTKLPASGALYKALGEIAITRADYAAAYEHSQKALELDLGDTRARFLGAVALTRLGRFEEALQAFQTVGQTDKDFPGLAVERGRLFEVSGRNADALVEYEAALKKSPEDPDVQTRVGCSRVIAGQAQAAQGLLESALKQRPRSAEASYCLGRALFDQSHLSDALTRLERAIDIDPSRAVYHLYSGWVATEMGRQGAAREALDRAIELDKGLGDAYWLRGRLLLKQGAAKDAILDLERATKLAPQRQDALADLAVAYADTARAPKALELWEQALARDPDNATWHFRYGKLLSSYGNGAMAAAHLKRAIEIVREAESAAPAADKPKPPLWIWQAHYLLARELGMVSAAVPHWQAYLRSSPRDDPYRSEAERALKELGQPWDPR
jgi:tetratricopeptide (TPR) repeat protein